MIWIVMAVFGAGAFVVTLVTCVANLAVRVAQLEERIEDIYSMTHGDGR